MAGVFSLQPLISVIVPVYNVENYIEKCINTILEQTYHNLEIILVDDGSIDSCPIICDEFANKDSRIKVIHKNNAGPSAARNAGIIIAEGEYIGFVDSDDYIHSKMYEVLYQNLKIYNADISVCNFFKVNDSYFQDSPNEKEKVFTYNSLEAMRLFFGPLNETMVIPVNKLYKRKLFENIRFPYGKYHEDEYIMPLILDEATIIVYTDISLYFYLQRDTSTMGKMFNRTRLDALEAYELRVKLFKHDKYIDIYPKACKAYLDHLIKYYYLLKIFYPEENNMFDDLKKRFDWFFKNEMNSKVLPLKTHLEFNLFYNDTNTYNLLINNGIYKYISNKIDKLTNYKKYLASKLVHRLS